VSVAILFFSPLHAEGIDLSALSPVFLERKDDMNAAGMIVVLTEVSGALGMPHFQSLITDGSISQSEFDGTRNLSSGFV
jgi:hypothetical protein